MVILKKTFDILSWVVLHDAFVIYCRYFQYIIKDMQFHNWNNLYAM